MTEVQCSEHFLFIGLLYIGTTGDVRASMATPALAVVDFGSSYLVGLLTLAKYNYAPVLV